MVRQPVLDLPTGVLVYTIAVGAAFLGLWMYYDRRDHRRFEQERRGKTPAQLHDAFRR